MRYVTVGKRAELWGSNFPYLDLVLGLLLARTDDVMMAMGRD